MRIVINGQFGGFSLSHAACFYYAKLCGFELYAFIHQRDSSGNLEMRKYKPYIEGDEAFTIFYTKKPLNDDGTYDEDAYFSCRDIKRNDANLIKTIEELGEKANGRCATLEIVEIPDDVVWAIEEYDGNEWVAEKHRTWR